MKKAEYNAARPNLSPAAYTDSNGGVIPASSDNPLPINIQSAIGAFTSPWKINYEDIVTNAVEKEPILKPWSGVVIPEEYKLYDNEINTYSKVTYVPSQIGVNGIPYFITLNVPVSIIKIVMIAKNTYNNASYANLGLKIVFYDGTDTGYISPTIIENINNSGLDVIYWEVDTTKLAFQVDINSYEQTELGIEQLGQSFDCFGLYIYVDAQKNQINMLTSLQDIEKNIDVPLSQAAKDYLYNATDSLSAYDLLKEIDTDFNTKIPSPFKFDSNGNLEIIAENPALAYDSTNNWFRQSIENDDVGLAKDSTLQTTLPRNITEISGTALTGRDWSTDFAFLDNIDVKLSTIATEATLQDIDTKISKYTIDEVNLPEQSTGLVSDNISIAATAQPSTPTTTSSLTFPSVDSNNITLYGTSAIIQINKMTGRLEMIFTNTDTSNAHTIYYIVELNGTTVVDNSTGTSIAAGGTLDAVHQIEQSGPSSGAFDIGIYAWADTANDITLTSHKLDAYIGTGLQSSDNVISINQDGLQTVASVFGGTSYGGSVTNYTWYLQSQISKANFANAVNSDLYINTLLPKTNISLLGSISGEIAYVTGISVLRKVV